METRRQGRSKWALQMAGCHGKDPSRSWSPRCSGRLCGIHDACNQTAEEYGAPGNHVLGANTAGFVRVAETMRMLGVI